MHFTCTASKAEKQGRKRRPLLASVPDSESGCSVKPGRRYSHPPAYSVLAGADRAPRVHRPPHRKWAGPRIGAVACESVKVWIPISSPISARLRCLHTNTLLVERWLPLLIAQRVGTNEYPYSCRSVRQNEALETLERQRRPHQGLFFALPCLGCSLDSRGHTLDPSNGNSGCALDVRARRSCAAVGEPLCTEYLLWRPGHVHGLVAVVPASCAYMIGRVKSQNHQIGCCNVSSQPKRLFFSLPRPEPGSLWEESDDGAFSVPARLTESVSRCTTRRVSQPICWGTAERHWLIGRISASIVVIGPPDQSGRARLLGGGNRRLLVK